MHVTVSFNNYEIRKLTVGSLSTAYNLSYSTVVLYRYKIIGLREISHFIKQPCRNICLEKAL